MGSSVLGCCEAWLDPVDEDDSCSSTGDPHVRSFSGKMINAYVDGEYLMYKGDLLEVSVRHTMAGREMSGNGASHLSGALMGGNTLTVYHQADVLGMTTTTTLWNGREMEASQICEKLLDGIACRCETDECGNFNIGWNEKWNWKTERCNPKYGWRNFYLYVDPADKSDTDDGFCMRTKWTPPYKPFPDYRLYCAETPFTKYQEDELYCQHAYDRRLESDQLRIRRREEGFLAKCDEGLKDAAKEQCGDVCDGDADDLEACMVDACLAGNVEGANDQAAGCFQAKLAAAHPDDRSDMCGADKVYSETAGKCVAPEVPDECIYEDCEYGIEVKGAGFEALNGLYTAGYSSCEDIPKYGSSAFGTTIDSVWTKPDDDKAEIQWYWKADDMRGWVVSYDDDIILYDGLNRESPTVFVEGTYTSTEDGSGATVTCAPPPEARCETFGKLSKACPRSVCQWVPKKGCKTKADGPTGFTIPEFCGYVKKKVACNRLDLCVFALGPKKCIPRDANQCENFRTAPSCKKHAKCVNNKSCVWDSQSRTCVETGDC